MVAYKDLRLAAMLLVVSGDNESNQHYSFFVLVEFFKIDNWADKRDKHLTKFAKNAIIILIILDKVGLTMVLQIEALADADVIASIIVRKTFNNVDWANGSRVEITVQNDVKEKNLVQVTTQCGEKISTIVFRSFEGMTEDEIDKILFMFANTSPDIIDRIRPNLERKRLHGNTNMVQVYLDAIREVLSRNFKHSEVQLTFMYHVLSHYSDYPTELIDWVVNNEEDYCIEISKLMNAHFVNPDNTFASLFTKFNSDGVETRVMELSQKRMNTNYTILSNYILSWLYGGDLNITFAEIINQPMNLTKIDKDLTSSNFLTFIGVHIDLVQRLKKSLDSFANNNNREQFQTSDGFVDFDLADENLRTHFEPLMNLTAFEMLSLTNFLMENSLFNEFLEFINVRQEKEETGDWKKNNALKVAGFETNERSVFLEELKNLTCIEFNDMGQKAAKPKKGLVWLEFFSVPGAELFGKVELKLLLKKAEEEGALANYTPTQINMSLLQGLVEWDKELDEGSNIPFSLMHNIYSSDFDKSEHIYEWEQWAEAIPFYMDENKLS